LLPFEKKHLPPDFATELTENGIIQDTFIWAPAGSMSPVIASQCQREQRSHRCYHCHTLFFNNLHKIAENHLLFVPI
jgi:hypothetical protein